MPIYNFVLILSETLHLVLILKIILYWLNNINIYSSKIDTLHSMYLISYHMLPIWQIGTYAIFCVIDMIFFVRISLGRYFYCFIENHDFLMIFLDFQWKRARSEVIIKKNFVFYFVKSKSICPKIYGQKTCLWLKIWHMCQFAKYVAYDKLRGQYYVKYPF